MTDRARQLRNTDKRPVFDPLAEENRHYYDGRLLTFPSPLTLAARPSDDGPGGYGVSLRRVKGGAYQEERARAGRPGVRPSTNPVEAHRVVEEVVQRFEAHPDGPPSLGVMPSTVSKWEGLAASDTRVVTESVPV